MRCGDSCSMRGAIPRAARLEAGQEEGEDPLGLGAARDAAARQLQHRQQVVNDLRCEKNTDEAVACVPPRAGGLMTGLVRDVKPGLWPEDRRSGVKLHTHFGGHGFLRPVIAGTGLRLVVRYFQHLHSAASRSGFASCVMLGPLCSIVIQLGLRGGRARAHTFRNSSKAAVSLADSKLWRRSCTRL